MKLADKMKVLAVSAGAVAAVMSVTISAPVQAADKEQFFPALVYRTGPWRSRSRIPRN